MKQTTFGKTAEGTEASLYTIGNSKGMRALVTNFGATLVSVIVKNKNGEDLNISVIRNKNGSFTRRLLTT